MENLINKKENNIEEEIISGLEEEWKISFNKEKLFWQQIIIPNMIYVPTNCPYSENKIFRIAEKKKNDSLVHFI